MSMMPNPALSGVAVIDHKQQLTLSILIVRDAIKLQHITPEQQRSFCHGMCLRFDCE
jgi:hypothetical protein